MKLFYLIFCILFSQNMLTLETEKIDERPTKCAYAVLQQPSKITCSKEDYTTKDLKKCNHKGDWRKEYFHNCEGSRQYKNPTATYIGQFQHNQPNGEGFLKLIDAEYSGFFKDGLKHGLGKAVTYNKLITMGWWVNGRANGMVEEHTPEMIYMGNMVDGVKNGHGMAVTQNLGEGNFIYVGNWKDDRFDGEGKLEVKEAGITMSGNFKDGNLHGKGMVKSPEALYTGEFKNNLFNGEGVLITYDLESDELIKSIQDGFFKDGKFLNDVCSKLGFKPETLDFSKCLLDLMNPNNN